MMKNVGIPPDERISAMADGELEPVELAHALGEVLGDETSVKIWHAYHVVGDALRSAELAADGRNLEFLRKFEQRLALEPVYPHPQSAAVQTALVGVPDSHSANASTLRWKLVAGVACSALAMVLGVGQWGQSESPPSTQLSAGPTTQPPAIALVMQPEAGALVMIRDPELDSLLAAHQQLGGHSALQRSSGFLRNATFEVPTR
jgi:sigma-E factor negative regulatory protein RseA